MKKFLFLVACLSGALLWSCSDEYDDSKIKAEMEELAARIEAVQQAVNAINQDLSTYQSLVQALQGTRYIKSVSEENGVVKITYNDDSVVTLTSGAKGPQGDKGDQGDQGGHGTMTMPKMKIESDGFWYISLDGSTWEKILDGNGNPIKGVGAQGPDGEQGAAAAAPVLGVDQYGYWTIDLGNGPQLIKNANGNPVVADPSKVPAGLFTKAEVKDGYLVVKVVGVDEELSIPIAGLFTFTVNFAAEESFESAQVRTFELTQKGVAEIAIERPAGWGVKVGETTVEVTAPVAASKGELVLYATSANGLLKVAATKVISQAPPRPAGVTFVVAKDGSGDYSEVQKAINAAASNKNERQIIYIKPGTYYEKFTIPKDKKNLTLIGEDLQTTVLTYDDYADTPNGDGGTLGTQGSAAFTVNGTGFMAQNITFENPHKNQSGVSGNHQAVAVGVYNDQATFYNCRLIGYQDTFYVKNNARVYCKDCYIEGNVDFIFGDAVLLCENCQLHCNRDGSVLTAAAEHTNSAFGFTFIDCKLTHIEGQDFNGNTFKKFHLGRPWKQNARVVFIRCDEPATLDPAAWRRMSEGVDAALFAEYQCTGEGATADRLAKREMGGRQLTDQEAATYTMANIFSKNTNPSKYGSDWTPPTKVTLQ